jgi:hypothetical protein
LFPPDEDSEQEKGCGEYNALFFHADAGPLVEGGIHTQSECRKLFMINQLFLTLHAALRLLNHKIRQRGRLWFGLFSFGQVVPTRKKRPKLLVTLLRQARVTHGGIYRIFCPLVKKTYLTLMYLTVVSTSKIKGFVLEKKNFREDVQKTPSLLK